MVDGACKISSINQSGGAGIEKKFSVAVAVEKHRPTENRKIAMPLSLDS